MGWNNDIEREVKRRVHKLSLQVASGQLVGPEVENAILDIFRHAWDHMDHDAPTLNEALHPERSRRVS